MTLDEFMFQSTPPRGRRLELRQRLRGEHPVSIHASAWEATPARELWFAGCEVSIHASAWEATPDLNGGAMSNFVSIHASAWEATP